MAGDTEGFTTLDIESCKRKQKADELIGYTEIYNSNFVNCELQDPATGAFGGRRPAPSAARAALGPSRPDRPHGGHALLRRQP